MLKKRRFTRIIKLQKRSFETFEEYKLRVLREVEEALDREITLGGRVAKLNTIIVFNRGD